MSAARVLYEDSCRGARGPGWRNAADAATTPLARAACYLEGARGACSRGAAWARAQTACEVGRINASVLGTARWPNLDAIEMAINLASVSAA